MEESVGEEETEGGGKATKQVMLSGVFHLWIHLNAASESERNTVKPPKGNESHEVWILEAGVWAMKRESAKRRKNAKNAYETVTKEERRVACELLGIRVSCTDGDEGRRSE